MATGWLRRTVLLSSQAILFEIYRTVVLCVIPCFQLVCCVILISNQICVIVKDFAIAFTLQDLADGRCHHCSVVVQRREEDHLRSRLYVMGGTNKGKVLKSVEYLDLKKKLTDLEQWKFAEDMQECRFLACAETFKGDDPSLFL